MGTNPISFRPTRLDVGAIDTIKSYLNTQHLQPGQEEWTDARVIRWAIHSKAGDLSGYAADAQPPRPAAASTSTAAVPVAAPKRRTAPKGT